MNNPLRRTETNMNKTLIIVGAAVLAAAMTMSVSTAEAGRHGGGGGARFSGGHNFHHQHHRRQIVVTPIYTETAKSPTLGQTQLTGTQGEAGEAGNTPAPAGTAEQNPGAEPAKFALLSDGNAA